MADPISVFSSNAVQGAYRSAGELKSTRPAPQEAEGAPSFAEMVKNAAGDAVQTMREADQVAQAGMRGEVGTQQVVEATIAMESTVKVAVSMRDKLVAAYQEVLRMPI
ncbi:flagellar biosynthesis protein [Aquicoccus sp. SCR17]|nr:flagellar biosynthesis protein [Carideicomes alvinocaridis]